MSETLPDLLPHQPDLGAREDPTGRADHDVEADTVAPQRADPGVLQGRRADADNRGDGDEATADVGPGEPARHAS